MEVQKTSSKCFYASWKVKNNAKGFVFWYCKAHQIVLTLNMQVIT